MKTYRIHDVQNNFCAFEISNTFISVCKIVKLLRANPNVAEIFFQSSFSTFLDRSVIFSGFAKPLSSETSPEVRVQFKYKGNTYVVWEPFGDNSRYWIGAEAGDSFDEIAEIEEIFINHVSLSTISSIFVLVFAVFLFGTSVMLFIEAYEKNRIWPEIIRTITLLGLAIYVVYSFIRERWK